MITINGVSYVLRVARCFGCGRSFTVVRGFAVRDCGHCGGDVA